MGQKTAWARREDGVEEWAVAGAPRYTHDLRAQLQPAEPPAGNTTKDRLKLWDDQKLLQFR